MDSRAAPPRPGISSSGTQVLNQRRDRARTSPSQTRPFRGPRPGRPDTARSTSAQVAVIDRGEVVLHRRHGSIPGLPVDDAELDDEQRARRLLAHLLEFHRREDKSMWWEFFHRCGFTEEEHVESRATLGALTCEGEAGQVKRSVIPVPSARPRPASAPRTTIQANTG